MAEVQPKKNSRTRDLTGQTFGRLTVVAFHGRSSKGRQWRCRCECGNEIVRPTFRLTTGNTRSCGCWRSPRTHDGKRATECPEFVVWCNMLARCFYTKSTSYAKYGGRGITVCDAWRTSFVAFYRDVGPRPTPEHELDRIDNDGNYEPGNVRWATRTTQARNKSSNRIIEFRGRRKPLIEWAKELGVDYHTLHSRLSTGWPVERALATRTATCR